MNSLKIWARVHTWSSLICTIFLLFLCVTGLPLIFHDEIDGWFDGPSVVPVRTQSGPASTIDDLIAVGRSRYPAEFPQYVFWPPDDDRVVHIGFAPGRNPQPEQVHRMVLDLRTQALSEPSAKTGVMQIVLKLHGELLAGTLGTLFLGGMGALFVAATVSGVVLYGPFMRRLKFGTVRMNERSGRALTGKSWLDLHNLLGAVTLVWALVVGATGIVNTLEKPLFAVWRAKELPLLLAPFAGKPQPTVLASVDGALAAARGVAPHMKITSVLFPYSRFNSPRHYLVWMKGDTALSAHLFTAIMVDAETGALTKVLDLPWYLKTLEVARPLHFGDYGGLPLKILWTILDFTTIVVLGTGLLLWVRKRGSRRLRPASAGQPA